MVGRMTPRRNSPWLSIAIVCFASRSFAQTEEKPAAEKPAAEKPAAEKPAQPPQAQPQPPPSGYPPPQYPPPGYGYPPPPGYYPVPYYVPVYEPPPPWKPGEPAPRGYHVETRVDKETIRSGVGMLVGFWVISVIAAAALNQAEEPVADDGDDVEPGDWSTLYWPIAGPFLTMKNVSTDDGGWALLLLDGVAQSVGALAIVIGLVSREEYLERDAAGAKKKPSVAVAPFVGSKQIGVGVGGAF
jgi:hypothetical protein